MEKMSETEGKILDLGTKLIQSRGVNGFSFADIAGEMGIKKASIHYYFPSKMDLIARVLAGYSQQFEQNLGRIEEEEKQLFQRLLDFTGLYREDLEDGQVSLCTMLATERHALSEEINRSVQEFFQLNLSWLEKVGLPANRAKDFYATLQGMQLLTKVSHNLDDFDQIMVDKIITIQK